jgi:hypothetical protein
LNNIPPKLLKNLSALSEKEAQAGMERYKTYFALAESHQLQSPRHWAMRQVLSGRTDQQIQRKLKKRLSK